MAESQTLLQAQAPTFALDFTSINYSYSYLAASKHKSQPLCGNSEGWGPISPFRYDFTPCFLDVWVASVAAFGIVFGAGAVYYLLWKCTAQPIKKDWHFWAKMVSRITTLPLSATLRLHYPFQTATLKTTLPLSDHPDQSR